MTTEEAKKVVGAENWTKFIEWMSGQTYGINDDGSTNWYSYDVERFAEAIKRGKIATILD